MLDDDDFTRWIARERSRRASELRVQRFFLLRRLRLAGVQETVGRYNAWGDSGNIEEVEIDSGTVDGPADLIEALGDFFWDLAYHFHPGFENNEGGFGEVTWDIETDSITLDHSDRIIETSQTVDTGI